MILLLIVTISCLFICAYVYVGYPIALAILKPIFGCKPAIKADITPRVTMMVSCYNEADVIREKIENCLSLEYPAGELNFIFVSDGSDDGTDNIVAEYSDQGVMLVRQEGRLGKTSGLNLGIRHAEGEIVVFSDANAMYRKDAILRLVRSFNDESVGYVVGAALYQNTEDNSASKSEDTYWQYEMRLKTSETDLHSVVGGDGAIYAIRRALYDDLDARDINDFVNPLQIIAKGYRGIFEPEAICYEEAAGTFDKEARRKERIVNRSFRGLMKVKSVMNPFKSGWFSFEVISHKLLRWLVPFFLITAAVGATLLALSGFWLFQIGVAGGVIFLWLAIVGYLKSHLESMPAIFYYPYYFLMVNYYSMWGVIRALQGNIQVTWSSPRQKNEGAQQHSLTEYGVIFLLILTSAALLYFVTTPLIHRVQNLL